MTNGSSPKPGTRKVTIGTISGAAITVVAYVLTQNGLTLPQEVFGAASTIVTALLVYMIPETYT